MPVKTLDPNVVIVATGTRKGIPWLRYRRLDTGDEWYVRGTCNQCGLCVTGAANEDDYKWDDEPGRPGAVRDVRFPVRPDEPVTPGFNEAMERQAKETPTATVDGCSLTVEPYIAR